MRHGVRVARRRCPSAQSATGPARGGPSPSPVSPRRARGGPLATALLRNQEVILHPLQLLHLRIAVVVNARHGDCQSFYRRASLDAFGDCLFRSAPEASHHQRRRDGNAGHNDPVQNGRDADRDRREEDGNRPGNEQQCLGIVGEHETSVATGKRARCSELHRVRRSQATDSRHARDQTRRWVARSAERSTPLDVRRREHGTQLFRTAQTATVLGDMIQDRQHTGRVGGGRTVELSGSGATCDGFCSPTHSCASEVHMASARGDRKPCTHARMCGHYAISSGAVASRWPLASPSDGERGWVCRQRTRATSSWPRTRPARGRRNQRASGALGRR